MQRLAQQDVLHAGEALSIMGYSSRAHAFTVFRMTTGMTPSEWWHKYHDSASEREKCLSIQCLFQAKTLEHQPPTTEKTDAVA
jgi:AraC-like DNA-binding protein